MKYVQSECRGVSRTSQLPLFFLIELHIILHTTRIFVPCKKMLNHSRFYIFTLLIKQLSLRVKQMKLRRKILQIVNYLIILLDKKLRNHKRQVYNPQLVSLLTLSVSKLLYLQVDGSGRASP